MKIIRSIQSMQKISGLARRSGHTIAFVPTMGALHDGHLSLVRRSRRLGEIIVVSIFVNPAQFAANEDLGKYPRTFAEDCKKLRGLEADYIFSPAASAMYPEGFETYVNLESSSRLLEGEYRPGHFRGVATVVCKLFNIVQPNIAVFGQKDFQQAIIIRKMLKDLNLPVKLVVAPTVREKSGLAMSSRNKYFNMEQKCRASVLYKSLKVARNLIRAGEKNPDKIIGAMRKLIGEIRGTKIDYIAITDNENLKPMKHLAGKFTISLAVRLDEVRLIDNIGISV